MKSFNWDLRNLTVQTHSGLRWSDIKRQLTDWKHSILPLLRASLPAPAGS